MKISNTFFAIFGLILCNTTFGIERSKISLSQNGYTGIVVAIDKSVSEDSNLLDKLKKLLTSASSSLYTATKRRAYFKEITIVIPNNWNIAKNYDKIGQPYLANIRLDSPNPSYEDTPYTLQPGGCGKLGDYIHITPNFLNKPPDVYGDLGKVLVHEWGHLRWGLFDEYPKDADVQFYQVGKKLFPVGCSEGIKGSPYNPSSNGKCKIDSVSHAVEPNCRFIPDLNANQPKSSYMNMQFLDSVTGFCDKNEHNRVAPNLQNNLCETKSSWEIMSQHPDFHGGNNPSGSESQDTTPAIKMVSAPEDIRFVLLHNEADIVQNIVSNVLPSHAYWAAVSVLSTGAEISDFILVAETKAGKFSNETRDKACKNLGCAMRHITQLVSKTSQLCHIIILTVGSGPQLGLPDAKTALTQAHASGSIFTVDTIAIGPNMTSGLRDLAAGYNGMSFSAPGVISPAVVGAADAIVGDRYCCESIPIMVENYRGYLPLKGSKSEQYFDIDADIGKDTIIRLDYSKKGLKAIIQDMDNNILYNITDNSNQVSNGYVAELKVPGIMKAGRYLHVIESNEADDVHFVFTVFSKKSNTTPPIKIRSTITQSLVDMSKSSGQIFSLQVTISQGYSPVLNANVKAIITSSSGSFVENKVVLKDNGLEMDNIKDDGIYSGFIASRNFDADGQFSIQLEANNDKLTAQVMTYLIHDDYRHGALMIPKKSNSLPPNPHYKTLPKFSRVIQGQEIIVSGFSSDISKLPPGRIRDLKSVYQNQDNEPGTVTTGMIILMWTPTPTQDKFMPEVSHIQVGVAKTFAELIDNFSSHILRSVSSNSKPLVSLFPPQNATFAAVRQVGENGVLGPLSNIVAFSFDLPEESTEFEFVKATDTPVTQAPTGGTPEEVIYIVAGVTGSIVLVIVIFCIVIMCLTKHKRMAIANSESDFNVQYRTEQTRYNHV